MNEPIEFQPVNLQLEEASVRRHEDFSGGVISRINYRVLESTFQSESDEASVSTSYSIEFLLDDDSSVAPVDDQDNVAVADVVSTFKLTMRASRQLRDSDASDGSLDPAQDLTNHVLHSYHRQQIMNLTVQLGLPAFQLPLTWQEVREKFDGNSHRL